MLQHTQLRVVAAAAALGAVLASGGCANAQGPRYANAFEDYVEDHAAVAEVWCASTEGFPAGNSAECTVTLVPTVTVDETVAFLAFAREFDRADRVSGFTLVTPGAPGETAIDYAISDPGEAPTDRAIAAFAAGFADAQPQASLRMGFDEEVSGRYWMFADGAPAGRTAYDVIRSTWPDELVEPTVRVEAQTGVRVIADTRFQEIDSALATLDAIEREFNVVSAEIVDSELAVWLDASADPSARDAIAALASPAPVRVHIGGVTNFSTADPALVERIEAMGLALADDAPGTTFLVADSLVTVRAASPTEALAVSDHFAQGAPLPHVNYDIGADPQRPWIKVFETDGTLGKWEPVIRAIGSSPDSSVLTEMSLRDPSPRVQMVLATESTTDEALARLATAVAGALPPDQSVRVKVAGPKWVIAEFSSGSSAAMTPSPADRALDDTEQELFTWFRDAWLRGESTG